MMSTARFFWIVVAVICGFVGKSNLAIAEKPNRPNIVWIVADDLSPDLACYGHDEVSTSNIDRLSQEGRRYTQAFSTAPVDSPSRSALITGCYQNSIGAHEHRTDPKTKLPKPVVPITRILRDAGYFVCNGNTDFISEGKEDYNFSHDNPLFEGKDWRERKQDQPFFAQVQIDTTHREYVSAESSERAKTLKLPAYYPDHPVVRADWANYLASIEKLDQQVGQLLDRLQQDGLTDTTIVFFFADNGRAQYRDKQWLYNGGIHVPLIVRWPKHIPAGEVTDKMVSLIDVTAATISAAGLEVPTWMDGKDMLAHDFAGREFIFAARDRCEDAFDRVRSVQTPTLKYIHNFYVSQPYWKHCGYKMHQTPAMTVSKVLFDRGELKGPAAAFWEPYRPFDELYDLTVDPEETNNLAESPGYQERLQKLRLQLDTWVRTSDNHGFLDGHKQFSKTAHASFASRDRYRAEMKDLGLAPDIAPEDYLKWWEEKLNVSPPSDDDAP